ncbi:MAG: bifunctional folylpolyglutamate synthase/dihydrofolate synthase [Acidobacteria bacterium]|nr:bifunctional folylpolyglutamate synthase/dihydrofolate synthase [Acidobacteriota bacterium]
MTYEQSIRYLLSLLGESGGAGLGLQRMQALVERLGRPDKAFRVVHVAGTNGKGSTAAMIASGLRAAGFRTGFHSSPHLTRFNERIEIDGAPVDDEAFVRAVEEVRAAIEALTVDADRSSHPTLFEAVTAAAFCAFRNAGVAWGVIEVGLGGRLDATNVVDSELAVITAIDLDHEAWLGKGLRRIAGEKAGILRPSGAAVSARQQPEAAAALLERAGELGTDLVFAPEQLPLQPPAPDSRGRFRIAATDGSFAARLALAGEHQVDNAVTAWCALERLGVEREAIRQGLETAQWPGRLEWFEGPPPALLDAAHNPSGARALAAHLRRFHADRKIRLVYGASRDKAVDEVAGLLFPLADRVLLTRAALPRAVSPETLLSLTDHLHAEIECVPSAAEALRRARQGAEPDTLLVVAGSIFLLGEIRPLLLAD